MILGTPVCRGATQQFRKRLSRLEQVPLLLGIGVSRFAVSRASAIRRIRRWLVGWMADGRGRGVAFDS
uniref:Uncharacterized protein n=1 Tax=Oryza nivara TaxID=4536 RepID=A0A0E0GIQ2_ORYNI